MDSITIDQAVDLAYHSILGHRLAFICGAGLSMAGPSYVPSAATIAAAVQAEYNSRFPGDPLSDDIEEQAAFFYERGEFQTIFIRSLIDPNTFATRPNDGHFALADLLLTRAADFALTTNVDTLIEMAGAMLEGDIGAGITSQAVAALLPETSPLLKIHGCWSKDKDTTVWTELQFDDEPLATRIPEAADWARNRLMNRDIVVVGFFTDWDYLNVVLRDALTDVQPARLLIVDPSEPAALEAKAPKLFEVGESATEQFVHLRSTGEEFLRAFRVFFSRAFVRRALHHGSDAFADAKGAPPHPDWLEPAHTDPDPLWRLRRDIEGCLPNRPASMWDPPAEPLFGLTVIELLAAGAAWEDTLLNYGGRRIRILRAANQTLHNIKAKFARDIAPVLSPDAVIAVGAENVFLPGHIVRGSTSASVARGGSPIWLTRPEAQAEFGI